MNKKILTISILAIFMLIAISFITTVSSNTTSTKRETPLFKIRTKLAIGERIKYLVTRFIETRGVSLLPSLLFKDQPDRLLTTHQWTDCSTIGCKNCGYAKR